MTDDKKPKEPQGLPEGWKWVRLGEVVIENPKSPFKVEDADNFGEFPFFTSGDNILRHSCYLVDGENLFIATGGKAKVNYYHGKASYSTDTYSIKAKGLNTKYTFYTLIKDIEKIDYNFFSGSGLKHLQKGDFKNILLPLPPLPEQRKIAQILETVDNAIEKTEKIIEKYKRIKQGLMQDLLTKGIDEKGNIRSEKTHKFKDSPLGRIPEEWEVVRLGEILKYEQPQKYIVKSEEYDEKSGIPVLTAGKTFILGYVDENEGICNDLPVILFDDFTTDSRYINFPFKVKSSATKILRARDESIDLFYVYNALQLIRLKPGSDHKRFWISEYSKMFIPLPPLSEQKRIAEILSQIDQVIEKEEKYKQKLERLKKGLMEDLLTGKVRVNKLLEGEVNEMA